MYCQLKGPRRGSTMQYTFNEKQFLLLFSSASSLVDMIISCGEVKLAATK